MCNQISARVRSVLRMADEAELLDTPVVLGIDLALIMSEENIPDLSEDQLLHSGSVAMV